MGRAVSVHAKQDDAEDTDGMYDATYSASAEAIEPLVRSRGWSHGLSRVGWGLLGGGPFASHLAKSVGCRSNDRFGAAWQ